MSQQPNIRVSGTALKAAVYIHGQKQLAAMGVNLRKGGFEVAFFGTGASAFWGQRGSEAYEAKINYPNLADNAKLNRREADLFAAFTLHEAGHVAYTDNSIEVDDKSTRGAFLFRVWNGIEDARMEHAVVVNGSSRGSRSMFKKLVTWATGNITGAFNPTSLMHAPFALALICRAALGGGNGYARALLSRIPEPKRSLYAEVAGRMSAMRLDRAGTQDSLDAANWFLNEWEARFGKIEVPAPVDGPTGPSESESGMRDEQDTPSSEDDFDESDDNRIAPPANKNAERSEEQGGGLPMPGGDDDEDGEDGDEDFDEDFGEDGDDDGDEIDAEADAERDALADEAEANAEQADVPSQRGSDSMFDSADEEQDEPEEDGGAGDGFSEVGGEPLNTEDIWNPEPDLSDLAKNINGRTHNAVFLPSYTPAHRSDMSKWNMDVSERSEKLAAKKLNKVALPAIKAQLARILKAPERCGWDAGAYSGRFNTRRQSRMAAGSEAVFKTRWETDGINTALSIVVDMSGSMSGVLPLALETAYTIASAAEASGCAVEISGFSDTIASTSSVDYGRSLGSKWGSASNDNRATGYGGTLVVMKRYDRRVESCAYFIKKAARLRLGGTPDYPCVRTAAELISTRPEQRKIVLVLTDGYGYVDSMEQLTRTAADLMGVEIMGIAIGMREPRNYAGNGQYVKADPKSDEYKKDPFVRSYRIGAWCPDFSDLSKVTLRTLIKHVESTVKGRRTM